MKKIKITVSSTVTVEFNEKSEEFKTLFENFNKYYTVCDYKEFAEHLATTMVMHGIEDIDGIGCVKINGKPQKRYAPKKVEEIEHPINVIGDIDSVNGLICSHAEEIEELN